MVLFFGIWGVALRQGLGLRISSGPAFILGMMGQTLLHTVGAFFVRMGWEFFLIDLLLTFFLLVFYRRSCKAFLSDLRLSFGATKTVTKALLLLVVLSALWKSAQPPFILDNESYYLQTIRWLNEHGLVKGLANLNVAFGQTSPWHILQAGFDSDFLSGRLNDLNGLLMVLFAYIALIEGRPTWLRYVLFFNVLLYQFVSAPSPDLPLIVLAPLAFAHFLEKKDGRWTVLLTFFLVFLKVTAAPFLLLALVPFWRKELKWTFCFIAGMVFFLPWIAKNLLLTGYPAFPMTFGGLAFDWTLPLPLARSLGEVVYHHEFLAFEGYRDFSLLDRLSRWFRFGGITGLFNIGTLALFVLLPLLRRDREFRIAYGVCALHFALVVAVSPQFRFFLPECIFLAALFIDTIVRRFAAERFVIAPLIVAAVLPLAVPLWGSQRRLTENENLRLADGYRWESLWRPAPSTRFPDLVYERRRTGTLEYASPANAAFFYTTGAGPLPCTNARILDYYEQVYHCRPELRTGSLGDGFRSAPTWNEPH